MPLPFADQTALVTGAASGIGRAIALHLADLGADVVLNDLAEADAEALALEVRRFARRAAVHGADVRRREEVASLFEAAEAAFERPVSLLVNNVGGLIERRGALETDEAFFQAIFDLNLKSVCWCVQAAVPGMRRARGGAIVNLSSIAAETGGSEGTLLYAAAKGALNTYTLGLARELAPEGVRVNAVAPGLIDTPFHAGAERSLSQRIHAIPMGRMGDPEEVARVVGYLLSERASYVTGQILTVGGGR